MILKKTWAIGFLLILTACGGGGSGDDGVPGAAAPENRNRLNWDAIPEEYHPEIEDENINLINVDKIELDIFGFDDDVEVIYDQNLDGNQGILRFYTVWYKTARWGQFNKRASGEKLKLYQTGQYSCSISIKNGAIESMGEGMCYVRIQMVLPVGAEIEVYNVGRLISRRFFAMTTLEFLEKFDDATWADDKFIVIEDFIESYRELSGTPQLLSEQLGEVIEGFNRSDDKFKALRRLHSFVTDRENLGEMIEDEFPRFDQDEAREIVGL